MQRVNAWWKQVLIYFWWNYTRYFTLTFISRFKRAPRSTKYLTSSRLLVMAARWRQHRPSELHRFMIFLSLLLSMRYITTPGTILLRTINNEEQLHSWYTMAYSVLIFVWFGRMQLTESQNGINIHLRLFVTQHMLYDLRSRNAYSSLGHVAHAYQCIL